MPDLIADNSQLQEFKNCQYRYWLHYGLGLAKRKEGEESHDRNFGSAIHLGLETYYRGGEWEKVRDSFVKSYPDQLQADDLAKTQENGITILQAYIEHYREQDKRFKILACEETDTFEIAPGIRFKVKIDLIVENLEQGGIYVMDHKTTGKGFDFRYWSQFEPNSQLTGYVAYAKFRFGACSGAYINGIRLGHRQRAYKGEPAGFYYEFQRQLFNRNQTQIENWKRDVLLWVKQMAQAKVDGYGKNMGQCNNFCSYKPVCMAEWNPLDEADMDCINIQYEKVNPFAYLEEKK